MTNESKLCGYIIYSDGKIDRDCSSASMLYNVHYGQVEDILDEVFDGLDENCLSEDEEELTGNGCIEFELTNLSWFDGQMSFPETCQWDIAPHWEFDFNVTKHEKFPEEDYIDNPPPSSRSEW